MIITIENFRCYENTKITINDTGITLLKGNSGSGKSTILEAIYWCLYGKTKLIYPKSNDKAKTRVTLEFSNIKIMRERNSSRLLFISNVSLEDDVAQEKINELYGCAETWLSSCYVKQGSKNVILQLGNKDKMDLISNIAFTGEDPYVYLEKLEKIKIEKEFELKVCQIEKDKYEEVFRSIYNPIYDGKKLSQEDLVKNQNNIKVYEDELKNLVQLQRKREDYTLLHSKYNEELKQIKNLDKPILQNSVETISELNDIERYLKSDKRIPPKSNQKYTNEDYLELVKAEKEILKYTSICSKYGLKYSQSDVLKKIKSLEEVLDFQNIVKENKRIDDIVVKINTIENNLESLKTKKFKFHDIIDTQDIEDKISFNNKEITILEEKIKHIEKSCNVFVCPHCSKSLFYKNGNISKSELVPCQDDIGATTTAKKEITSLKNSNDTLKLEIKKINSKKEENNLLKLSSQKNIIEIENLEKELRSLKDDSGNLTKIKSNIKKILSEVEIKTYYSNISELKSLEFYEIPAIKSSDVKKYLDYLTFYNEEFEKYNLEDITAKKNIILKYERELKIYEDNERLKLSIQNKIDNLQYYEDVTDKIENTKKQIESCKDKILCHDKACEIDKICSEAKKKKKLLDSKNSYLIYLNKIKKYITDAQNYILEDTVESINSSINNICNTLFNNDITVKLSLTKKLKTKDITRPIINFSISYFGCEFDNIDQLSGGEQDRISLAITIALGKLTNFPLLILDESLASLDLDTKEKCIKTLREHSDFAVLVVIHDGVEGIFDDVICL
jgi:exonuclease SbcC